MFDINQVLSSHLNIFPKEREISEQLSELIALKNYELDCSIKYNKILISDSDKIIPTKSQVAYLGAIGYKHFAACGSLVGMGLGAYCGQKITDLLFEHSSESI